MISGIYYFARDWKEKSGIDEAGDKTGECGEELRCRVEQKMYGDRGFKTETYILVQTIRLSGSTWGLKSALIKLITYYYYVCLFAAMELNNLQIKTPVKHIIDMVKI